MPRGGKRVGAGRKKGSSNFTRITEHFTQKEIDDLVKEAKKQAKKRPEILKFLLEQIFGKAHQSVDIGNKDGEVFKIGWEK